MRCRLPFFILCSGIFIACGSSSRAPLDQGELEDGGAGPTGIDPRVADAANVGAPSPVRDGSAPPLRSPFPVIDAGLVFCGDTPCACADGRDDDDDGLVDLADPECVSSWDDDESSFATGLPGDNRDTACQDCFFDGNSGSGNDGCRVATSCLTAGNTSSGRGSCNTCEATEKCRQSCLPYTPNGCDCFGCCTVHLGSNITKSVLIAPDCDIDGTTLTGCSECVPSATCGNTCGECELCPGKSLADLPASCTARCDEGQQWCGDGTPCLSDSYCQFGCCVLKPAYL